jgi:hypothetical protein
VTELGIDTRFELALNIVTSPPAGAGPVRVTVPVVEATPATVDGLKLREARVTAVSCRFAVCEMPPHVAVIVTLVVADTEWVVTAKVTLDLPGGTVTETGAVAAELFVVRSTVRPFEPVGPFSVTVPTAGKPPTTVVGLTETARSVAGMTDSVPCWVPPFTLPVTLPLTV